jgi:hypothetical protein
MAIMPICDCPSLLADIVTPSFAFVDVRWTEVRPRKLQYVRKPPMDDFGKPFAAVAGPTNKDLHLRLHRRFDYPPMIAAGNSGRGLDMAQHISTKLALILLATRSLALWAPPAEGAHPSEHSCRHQDEIDVASRDQQRRQLRMSLSERHETY